jgi:hypothetical protein
MGEFRFPNIDAGRYAVEVINPAGQIIGTSAAVDVTEGATITGVTVTTSPAAAMAGSAAASSGIGTATIVTIAAVAAGAGLGAWAIHHATSDNGTPVASPSR